MLALVAGLEDWHGGDGGALCVPVNGNSCVSVMTGLSAPQASLPVLTSVNQPVCGDTGASFSVNPVAVLVHVR